MNLSLGATFPAYHKKKGQTTNFEELFLSGEKIHTVRENPLFWKRRIKSSNGKLSLTKWIGVPYNKGITTTIIREVYVTTQIIFKEKGEWFTLHGAKLDVSVLAKNDGLSVEDFENYFRKTPDKEFLLIIHFTNFQY